MESTPASHRVVDAFQAHGVRRHFVMFAVRLIHDGVELLGRKGGNAVHDTVGSGNPLVGVNFNPVGPVGNLLAHRFAALDGSVHHLDAVRKFPGRVIALESRKRRSRSSARVTTNMRGPGITPCLMASRMETSA